MMHELSLLNYTLLFPGFNDSATHECVRMVLKLYKCNNMENCSEKYVHGVIGVTVGT